MSKEKIGIIGMGYVGLPLAVAFAKKFPVVGIDINHNRINELNNFSDTTKEIDNKTLKKVVSRSKLENTNGLYLTTETENLSDVTVFIVTVPTPIDKNKNPILKPLIEASLTVAKFLKKNDIVIYESTVYPGLTEEKCIPILETNSLLKFNVDFYVGYSPERINPGDKLRTVTKIKKITSGSTPESAKKIDDLYNSVITAGTHLAPSIIVAEAAKVIENAQRDINIAFVNELAKIFDILGVDTKDVLEAASTKWNFLPFNPGLVGGHCIGVDPYYLANRAQEIGYYPEIILAGRRINDNMGIYVANRVIKLLIAKGIKIIGSRSLVLGITFKENCPDIRNSKVIDVIDELKQFGIIVDVYDSWADSNEVFDEFGIDLVKSIDNEYDSVVLAVAHDDSLKIFNKIKLKENSVVYDVKSALPTSKIDNRL